MVYIPPETGLSPGSSAETGRCLGIRDWRASNENDRRHGFTQVADFLVADTYLDVALESTRDLLLEMQVRLTKNLVAYS